MDEKWIWAAVAVIAGFAAGALAARMVRRAIDQDSRSPSLRRSGSAFAGLAFSICLIAGLVIALGIANKESLDSLPESIVDYIPRALSAAIVLIGANVVASFAATAVDQALGHVSPGVRRRVPTIVRGAIMVAAGLIAANQLGVDTTILTLAAAALFFSLGLSAALVAGIGTRQVTSEVTAGRALRRVLTEGDRIESNEHGGVIVKLHGVSAEIETDIGDRQLVPYTSLLEQVVTLRRSTRPTTDDDLG